MSDHGIEPGGRIARAFGRLRPAFEPLSPRKQVLAYVAFARRFEPHFPNDLCRDVLAVAERVAEGEGVGELRELSRVGNECLNSLKGDDFDIECRFSAYIACELKFYAGRRVAELSGRFPGRRPAAEDMYHTMLEWLPCMEVRGERFEQDVATLLDLLGEVGGGTDAFAQAWRTSDAVGLAGRMYDTRDFSMMPILADALQDAGCDQPDVLNHCRGAGPHVRGCWVVDHVLGKA